MIKSSVEWFFEVLALNDIIDHNRLSDDENLYNLLYRLKKQAKQIEKEHIINAWERGQYIGMSFSQRFIPPEFEQDSEQYYNENFKSE